MASQYSLTTVFITERHTQSLSFSLNLFNQPEPGSSASAEEPGEAPRQPSSAPLPLTVWDSDLGEQTPAK